MQTKTILLTFGISMALAGSAQAGNFTADCEGWADDGIWEVPHPAEVVATATLERFDATTGSWIAVETSVDTISLAAGATFEIGGTWGGPLDGSYRASIDFAAEVIYSAESKETWHFYASYGPYDCAPPPSSNERRTPGYWKNHPESWPVTSLTIGGSGYSQSCLLGVLDLSTGGDTRIKLLHHLIAAKLNRLPNTVPDIGGTDASIQPTIDAADAFLIATNTTIDCGSLTLSGARLSGAQRNQSNALKDALDAYNNNADIGSSSSSLSAEEGGCTAMNAEGHLLAFALPLLALLSLRRRRN